MLMERLDYPQLTFQSINSENGLGSSLVNLNETFRKCGYDTDKHLICNAIFSHKAMIHKWHIVGVQKLNGQPVGTQIHQIGENVLKWILQSSSAMNEAKKYTVDDWNFQQSKIGLLGFGASLVSLQKTTSFCREKVKFQKGIGRYNHKGDVEFLDCHKT